MHGEHAHASVGMAPDIESRLRFFAKEIFLLESFNRYAILFSGAISLIEAKPTDYADERRILR